MKTIIRTSSVFVFLIMIVSCAGTPIALPEKYNLGDELKAVDRISSVKTSAINDIECDTVDRQSIILKINRDDYYLIVLRQPIDIQYPQLVISIDNTASKDRAYSADRIITGRNQDRNSLSNETTFVQAPSNIANIVSGIDKVVVQGREDKQFYVIQKIYKLKGKEQAEKIKARIRKS